MPSGDLMAQSPDLTAQCGGLMAQIPDLTVQKDDLRGKSPHKNRQHITPELEADVVKIINDHPGIQRKELAEKLGVSIRTLDRLLAQMTTHPLGAKIGHRGSKKTGGWFRKS